MGKAYILILIAMLLLNNGVFTSEYLLENEIILKVYRKKLTQDISLDKEVIPVRIDFSSLDVEEIEKEINRYSAEYVLSMFPQESDNRIFYIVPVEHMFFLPIYSMHLKWKDRNIKMIILNKGVFSMESLFSLINNENIIEKVDENTFVLKSPIFISEHASLIIKEKEIRLSVEHGSPIFVNGGLYVFKSKLLSWSVELNEYYPIPSLQLEDYLLYGRMEPRPYILILKSGSFVSLYSIYKGLGYRDLFSSFGISMGAWELPGSKWSFEKGRVTPKYTSIEDVMSAILLKSVKKPKIILIGNDFFENYMGFYSNKAEGVIVIGNHFKDNYQYGIDPHDWSEDLLFAYNIVEGTKKAHGLIFSRGVKGFVYKNLLFGNNGAGIMMDRGSKSIIAHNIVFLNRKGGVSIIESDENIIYKNKILFNKLYGVYVRNSVNVLVKENEIKYNVGNGVEVTVANISYQTYRNLYEDPFRMASSAWLEGNYIIDNILSEIKSFYGGVAIHKNIFPNRNVLFRGTISTYTDEILNSQHKRVVVLPGKGSYEKIGKVKYDTIKDFSKIIEDLIRKGNKEAIVAYNILNILNKPVSKTASKDMEHINNIYEIAKEGDSYSIFLLGVLFYSMGEHYKYEGITLLAEAAILGNNLANYFLYILPMLTDIDPQYVNDAFDEAIRRLESGRIVSETVASEFFNEKDRDNAGVIKINRGNVWKRLMNFKLKLNFKNIDTYWEIAKYNSLEFINESYTSKISNIHYRIKDKNKVYVEYLDNQKKILQVARRDGNRDFEIYRRINKRRDLTKVMNIKFHDMYAKHKMDIYKPVIGFLKKFNNLRDVNMKINENEYVEYIQNRYMDYIW